MLDCYRLSGNGVVFYISDLQMYNLLFHTEAISKSNSVATTLQITKYLTCCLVVTGTLSKHFRSAMHSSVDTVGTCVGVKSEDLWLCA